MWQSCWTLCLSLAAAGVALSLAAASADPQSAREQALDTWRAWRDAHPLPLPEDDQAEERLVSDLFARHSFADARAALVEREVRREYLRLVWAHRQSGPLEGVAATAFRPEAVVREGDRDPADFVLRTTRALLADLKPPRPGPARGPRSSESWRGWRPKVPQSIWPGRRSGSRLYRRVCELRRRIAFSNPLLDFGGIVFVKRRLSVANHMCDQYYGNFARAGGGLFVLEDPFGPSPRVRNVLEGSTVENGRLQGQAVARQARSSNRPFPTTGRRSLFPVRPDTGSAGYPGRGRSSWPFRESAGRSDVGRGDEGAAALDPGDVVSHLPRGRRRDRLDATHRRAVERLAPQLAARRADRLHLRAARGIRALPRPAGAALHPARDGRRRPQHGAAQPPRGERMAPVGRQQRDDRLHPLGLRGPRPQPGASSVDHRAGRP